MRVNSAITFAMALLLMATCGNAQTAAGMAGVWKLDINASNSTGGMPTASTLTISESPGGVLRYEIRDVFDGRAQAPWAFEAGPESDERPVVPASFIDSVQTTHRRGRTSTLLLKKGATVVSEMTTELSEDGATLTVKSKATSPNGDTVTGTSIYRREPS
jgi:hypothetical protein